MEKSVELILNKLTELCVSLGLKITEFFPYVVKQVTLEYTLSLISISIILPISYLLFFKKFVCEKDDGSIDKDTTMLFRRIVLIFLLGVFLISLMACLPVILNPEYKAIERIMRMVK